jgi:RHS repeat-associated protein
VTIAQAIPTYTVATNTGATETVVLGQSATPNSTLVVGGTITAGDTISLTAHYPSLPSGLKTVTYTVLSTDTVKSVATGLTALFNADTNIQSLDLTSTNVVAATLNTSETFSANPVLAAPQNNASVSAIDGGNNTKTNSYQVGSTGALAQNLSYDLNGNLLSDGTNTYQWDAENRLIQINYPGSGNYSTFSYDALYRLVKIVENVASNVSSTKQFVCGDGSMSESRNADGSSLNQYFGLGQTISGSNYFYSIDSSGSIKEITNASGSIQSTYCYGPYGQKLSNQGSLNGDFQYAGYYWHEPSGLNLSTFRPYNASTGRWINRDPIGEAGGTNLYDYVENDPISFVDPSGLDGVTVPITPLAPPNYVHTGLQIDTGGGGVWDVNGMYAPIKGHKTKLRLKIFIDPGVLGKPKFGYFSPIPGPKAKAKDGNDTCFAANALKNARALQNYSDNNVVPYTAWPGVTGPLGSRTSNNVPLHVIIMSGGIPPSLGGFKTSNQGPFMPPGNVPFVAPGYNTNTGSQW